MGCLCQGPLGAAGSRARPFAAGARVEEKALGSFRFWAGADLTQRRLLPEQLLLPGSAVNWFVPGLLALARAVQCPLGHSLSWGSWDGQEGPRILPA